ncbi:hypothetical protein FW320_25050 [Azospirillum sp. Vi22]|nr:hypothetical protein [Azospirillum baldaniorum]
MAVLIADGNGPIKALGPTFEPASIPSPSGANALGIFNKITCPRDGVLVPAQQIFQFRVFHPSLLQNDGQ